MNRFDLSLDVAPCRIWIIPDKAARGRNAIMQKRQSQSADIGSLRPGDYADVTRNASYYVVLVQQG